MVTAANNGAARQEGRTVIGAFGDLLAGGVITDAARVAHSTLGLQETLFARRRISVTTIAG